MSDKGERTKLAKSALFLISGQSIVFAGNLLVGLLLVRILSKSEYGTFLQVNLLTETIGSLVVFGLPASLFYFIPKLQSEQVKRFVAQNLVLLLLLGVSAGGLIYAVSDHVASLMNNQALAGCSVYIVALLLLGVLAEPIEPIMVTLGNARWVAALNVGFMLGNLLFVPAAVLSGYGLEGVFLATMGLLGVKVLVAYGLIFNRSGSMQWSFSFAEIREQLRYVAPIGMSRILSNLNIRLDQFIISYLYAPTTYAIYARGAFKLPIVPIITNNVSNVLLPTLVRLRNDNELEKMLELWHASIKKSLLVLVPIGVFFCVFAKETMIVLFTEEYVESASIFMLYLCTIPFEATLYGNIHQAFGQTRHVLIANIMSVACALALNGVFYHRFGILGPAIAIVLARLIAVSYHLAIIRTYFGLPFLAVFPFRFQVKMLGICGVVVLLVVPLKLLAVSTFVVLALAASTYAVFYLAVLWLFNLLTVEEKSQIMQWMPVRIAN